MAEVSIEIGGRSYPVHCRDGEEEHLRRIAGLVDAKAQDAARAVGSVNETRHLLFAALLLADELNDNRNAAPAAETPAEPVPQSAPQAEPIAPKSAVYQPDFAPIIEKLAARLESLAEKLESGPHNP
jgi:cell division protein ZapA